MVTLAYWVCCCALGLLICGVWTVGYSLFSSEPSQRDVNSALAPKGCQGGRSSSRYAYTQFPGFRYIQGAPCSSGASSFVPAGLTAHIQYGAGSTDPILLLMGATPTTGTKLKAPPISSPDGAFFCLIQTS
jgi:hypothetical protein